MSVRIITGDCRDILPTLPGNSFDCIVTSPPYWGLRDYGVEGQIGLEPTLALYLETMVGVFRELRRVLKPSGTAWLNVGDVYAGGGRGGGSPDCKQRTNVGSLVAPSRDSALKPKDLCMVPNRLALLLQEDGWYIRSEIIWFKQNPMPESVTDRPTCAHEKVWLLTKSASYFYDAGAIREDATSDRPDMRLKGLRTGRAYINQSATPKNFGAAALDVPRSHDLDVGGVDTETRNARNVWSIASEPYRGAHYAVMPSTLAERCIKAGSSERGCCAHCWKPWERQTDRVDQGWDGSRYGERAVAATGGAKTGGTAASTLGSSNGKLTGKRNTIGWRPTCSCDAHEPVPCSILDPFFGAGTTGLVADRLGRHCTGIELNPTNVGMGKDRVVQDGPLFAEVSA